MIELNTKPGNGYYWVFVIDRDKLILPAKAIKKQKITQKTSNFGLNWSKNPERRQTAYGI